MSVAFVLYKKIYRKITNNKNDFITSNSSVCQRIFCFEDKRCRKQCISYSHDAVTKYLTMATQERRVYLGSTFEIPSIMSWEAWRVADGAIRHATLAVRKQREMNVDTSLVFSFSFILELHQRHISATLLVDLPCSVQPLCKQSYTNTRDKAHWRFSVQPS